MGSFKYRLTLSEPHNATKKYLWFETIEEAFKQASICFRDNQWCMVKIEKIDGV